MGLLVSRSPLHGEHNGLQQSTVFILELTDPTIILVLIMMMMTLHDTSKLRKGQAIQRNNNVNNHSWPD